MPFHKSGTSPNKSCLNWVIRVASTNFKETAHLRKEDTICAGNFKILLVTVSHMAFSTL